MTSAESEANERAILGAIERNQQRFRQSRSPRRRYLICQENEALFEKIGVRFDPMVPPQGVFTGKRRRRLQEANRDIAKHRRLSLKEARRRLLGQGQ